MTTESISILAITLCMMFLFVRAKRPDYAVSLVPLLLVPAAQLLALPVAHALGGLAPHMHYRMVVAFADVAALAISCGLVELFSSRIKSKKNKRLYIALLIGFNIILACVFIYRTLQPILAAM